MTRTEAAKLLELIQLAYPHAYKNLDDRHRLATVRMWAASFPQVPYTLLEQGFNRYRMENKFPPTVADMAAELRTIHRQAEEAMLIQRSLGNPELEAHFRGIMEATIFHTRLDSHNSFPENTQKCLHA